MRFRLAVLLLVCTALAAAQENSVPVADQGQVESLSLRDCLQRALTGNHRRKISQFAVSLAEAQHRQALSGYWPQIKLQAGIQRSDQPVNFLLPGQSITVPSQPIAVQGGAALVTIPANAFGPGFPPSNVQLPVAFPGQTVNTPRIGVPASTFDLAGRDLATGSLKGTLLVFDGGLRKGLREQANAGVSAMMAEARRTDLEVADTVTRLYWAAVFSRQLKRVGDDALAELEVTLKMTDIHVQNSAGKVNKTDYLFNKVVVEAARSQVAELEKNVLLAQAALANTMGLSWSASVAPLDASFPAVQPHFQTGQMVSEAYSFNPDWAELEAGLRAAEGALKTRRSDYYPKLALNGDLHSFWNGGYDGGISTAQNRLGWTVGAGVEVPVFNGLLTQGQVSEAWLKVRQLKETQLLLKDGLGLQVKSLLLELDSAAKVAEASGNAETAAEENRELNFSAYENDLAEADKVVQSQIMAALAKAQHLKSQYEQICLLSKLNTLVGHQVAAAISGGASRP